MKFNRLIGLLIMIACMVTSCRNKAVEYNNQLVKIQQDVLPQVQGFAKKWSSKVDSFNIATLEPEASKIVQELNQKIAEVNALPMVENGQNLKNAIIAQLEFEKNQCYKLGRLADPAVTSEEKASIEQQLISAAPDADKITARITETQKEFAKKNNFTLQYK